MGVVYLAEDLSLGSPDGKSLAFHFLDGQTLLIAICDLPACTERQRLKPPFNTDTVRWTPDGSIAYAVGTSGNIWVHPLDGSPPRQLTHFTDGREILDFAWSRDGKRLAIARALSVYDIVLMKGLKPTR